MPKKAPHYIPEGMNTLTAHLWFNGNCKEAIAFYQTAFNAKLVNHPMPTPDGQGIIHATMEIGDSKFMLADAWPGAWEKGPVDHATMGMWLCVPDCDAAFDQAVKAGCEVVSPVMDMFWGDRTGKVKDPFGHCWGIATYQWEMTEEEIQQGYESWMASMSQ